MIEMRKTPTNVVAVISADDPITYLAATMQTSMEWLLCHGINKIQFLRTRRNDGTCVLQTSCMELRQARALTFASRALINELVDENYISADLEENWHSQGPIQLGVSEQMNRIIAKPDFTGASVLRFPRIRTDISVCDYAFATCEKIVPFFVKGCTLAKHQTSIAMAETWLNFGMRDDEFTAMMETRLAYDATMPLNKLPLYFSPK